MRIAEDKDLSYLIQAQREIIAYYEGVVRVSPPQGTEGRSTDFKYLEKMRAVQDILVGIREGVEYVKDNTRNS